MTQRPPIPQELKREIRQRCGFGCVICGMPLYEYEHMLEWAEVQRHVAGEITLLCRQHHGEKTNGLLPKEVVVASNQNPYNKQPVNHEWSKKRSIGQISIFKIAVCGAKSHHLTGIM